MFMAFFIKIENRFIEFHKEKRLFLQLKWPLPGVFNLFLAVELFSQGKSYIQTPVYNIVKKGHSGEKERGKSKVSHWYLKAVKAFLGNRAGDYKLTFWTSQESQWENWHSLPPLPNVIIREDLISHNMAAPFTFFNTIVNLRLHLF